MSSKRWSRTLRYQANTIKSRRRSNADSCGPDCQRQKAILAARECEIEELKCQMIQTQNKVETSRLAKDVQELTEKCQLSMDEIERLSKVIGEQEQEKASLQVREAAALAEAQKAQTELKALSRKNVQLEETLEKANERSLKADLKFLEAKKQGNSDVDSLSRLEIELESLREELKRVRSERTEMRKACEQKADAWEKERMAHNLTQGEVKALNVELIPLREMLERLNNDKLEAVAWKNEAENKAKEQSNMIERLQTELAKYSTKECSAEPLELIEPGSSDDFQTAIEGMEEHQGGGFMTLDSRMEEVEKSRFYSRQKSRSISGRICAEDGRLQTTRKIREMNCGMKRVWERSSQELMNIHQRQNRRILELQKEVEEYKREKSVRKNVKPFRY